MSVPSKDIACAVQTRVVACTPVCREHVCIEVSAPRFPASTPGQFLQLLCRDEERSRGAVHEWRDGEAAPRLADLDLGPRQPYLRRPFSIADQWVEAEERTHLRVISRNVGPGTRWLERLRPGAVLDVTGPLGHGFTWPEKDLPLVLIGGGVGIPPLLYLARRLHAERRRHVVVILGVRTCDLLPVPLLGPPSTDGAPRDCVEYPGGGRFGTIVTTDDGSLGLGGFVTDALRRWCASGAAGQHRPHVFACGPEAMLRAVAQTTRELDCACQLCIERNMGCGLGTCLSCVVRARDTSAAEGWRWRLACQYGPVFDRDALLDYGPPAGA